MTNRSIAADELIWWLADRAFARSGCLLSKGSLGPRTCPNAMPGSSLVWDRFQHAAHDGMLASNAMYSGQSHFDIGSPPVSEPETAR